MAATASGSDAGPGASDSNVDRGDIGDMLDELMQEYSEVSVGSALPPAQLLKRATSLLSDICEDDERTTKLWGALHRTFSDRHPDTTFESPIGRTVSYGGWKAGVEGPALVGGFACPPQWQSPEAAYFDPASPPPQGMAISFGVGRRTAGAGQGDDASPRAPPSSKTGTDSHGPECASQTESPGSCAHGVKEQIEGNFPAHYRVGALLGEGAYGSVYEAWDQQEQRRVAIKRIRGVFFQAQVYGVSRARCKRILREVAILSHLQHEHIVQIYDLPEPSGTDLYIVMERCDTDIRKICDGPCGVSLPQARELAHGLLDGCKYLHSAGVYHRDLKPENCLVNVDCCVKICDFNLARMVIDDQLSRTLTFQVATQWYRAPEVILRLPYSEAMDVWSAGCIVAELLQALNEGGREPRHGALFPGGQRTAYSSEESDASGTPDQSSDQLGQIFRMLGTPSETEVEALPSDFARGRVRDFATRQGCGLRSWLPSEAGEDWLDLLQHMLQFLPSGRPSMAEALQHAAFEGVSRPPEEQAGAAPGQLKIDFTEDELERTASTIPRKLRLEIDRFQQQAGKLSGKRW